MRNRRLAAHLAQAFPAALLACLAQSLALAGTTVKSRLTTDGQTIESTTYTSDQRQRIDLGQTRVIRQCDLKQIVEIDDKSKTYVSAPMPAPPAAPQCAKPPAFTEAGEKKQLFGLTATRWKAAGEGCAGQGKIEIDGWFVPFDQQSACSDPGVLSGGRGLALQYTVASTNDKGEVSRVQYEVLGLTLGGKLEAPVFEPPADYRALGVTQAAAVRNPAFQEALTKPKTAGAARIGLAAPGLKSGQGWSTASMDSQLAATLRKAGIEAVPLGAGTPGEIEERARQSQVDQVLYADLNLVKGGGSAVGRKLGMVTRMTSGAAPKEAYTATIDYRLVDVAGAVKASSSVSVSTGGFSIRDAMNVAQFASQFMMPMMMMNGLGGMATSRMMNSAMWMGNLGGMDPTMMAMQSAMGMMQGAAGGAQPSKDEGEVVNAALDKLGKAVMQSLKPQAPQPASVAKGAPAGKGKKGK